MRQFPDDSVAILRAPAQTVYEKYTFASWRGRRRAGLGWYDGTKQRCAFQLSRPAVAVDTNGNIYTADQ